MTFNSNLESNVWDEFVGLMEHGQEWDVHLDDNHKTVIDIDQFVVESWQILNGKLDLSSTSDNEIQIEFKDSTQKIWKDVSTGVDIYCFASVNGNWLFIRD